MWKEARQLCSRASQAFGRCDHELALKLADEALAIDGFAGTDHAAQAYDVRGDVLRSAARYDEALAALLLVTDRQPARWHGHIKVAGVLLRLSRFAEALASVDRAIALTPDDAPGTWALGHRLTHLASQARADASADGSAAFEEVARRCVRVAEDACERFPDHPTNRQLRKLRDKTRELLDVD